MQASPSMRFFLRLGYGSEEKVQGWKRLNDEHEKRKDEFRLRERFSYKCQPTSHSAARLAGGH